MRTQPIQDHLSFRPRGRHTAAGRLLATIVSVTLAGCIALSACAQGTPARPADALSRAQAALQVDDYAAAAREFEAARASAGDTHDILRGLLLSYLQLKRLPEAIVVGNVATARWPQDADLHHWLGLAHFQAGDNAQGGKELQTAVRLRPTAYDLHFDLALIYMTEKQYSAAATELEQAVRLQPRQALAHVLLGRAYQNSNRALAAIGEFKKALQLEPRLPLGHYHLGYAYAGLGRNQQAIAEYRKELAIQPDHAEVLYQLGHTLMETSAVRAAIPLLEQATQRDPRNADAFYDLGKAWLLTRDYGRAAAALRQAIALDPADPSPHYLLARTLQKAGQTAEAQQEWQRFSQLKQSVSDEGGMATGRVRK